MATAEFESFSSIVPRSGQEVRITFGEQVYPSAIYPDKGEISLGEVKQVINAADDPKVDPNGKYIGLSYVVYVGAADPHTIHYCTGPGHADLKPEFNRLWVKIVQFLGMGKQTLKPGEAERLVAMAGQAVGNGLEGDSTGMEEGLRQIWSFALPICQGRTRIIYIPTVLLLALLVGGSGLFMIYNLCAGATSCGCSGPDCDEWSQLLAAALFGGALGTVLFAAGMSRTAKDLPYDPFAGRGYVCFEGVLRVFVGISGALVVAMAAASGAITSKLIDKGENELLIIALFSVLGGYFERYAPTLLRKVSPVELPPPEAKPSK